MPRLICDQFFRPVLSRFVLAAFSLLFFFLIVEVAFRIQDFFSSPQNISSDHRIHREFFKDDFGCFRIRPLTEGWHQSYDRKKDILIKINSHGFRGPEPVSEKAIESFRIAFVGDSIIFDGGNEFEDTLAFQTCQALSAQSSGRWDCLNFGCSDMGINDYVLKVRHHVLELNPSALVVGLYLNDSRPPQGFLGENGRTLHDQCLEESVLYRFLTVRRLHGYWTAYRIAGQQEIRDRFRWVNRYRDRRYLVDEKEWNLLIEEAQFDWGAAWNVRSWDVISAQLKTIKTMADQRGIDVLVVLFPVEPQLHINAEFENAFTPQAHAALVFKELSIEWIDLLPAFRQNAGARMIADQCHLTAAGNRIASELISEKLQSKVKR